MIRKDVSIKKIHVRSGDSVVVLCGKDRGKRGKVLAVSPRESKVIVSGVAIVSKHVKARKPGDDSGIVKTESALYSCKVQLVCPHCDLPTRIAHVFEGEKKLRVCKKCKKTI
jgi:large subunit ribosomal protein L24